MAKVELPGEIKSLSGALGGVIFRTYKKPDGTTETRMYKNPYHTVNGRSASHRATVLTPQERAVRAQFAQMSRAVSARQRAGDKRPKSEIWKEVKAEYAAREH